MSAREAKVSAAEKRTKNGEQIEGQKKFLLLERLTQDSLC